MSESYVYSAVCELCYSTKGQFATLMLLKQFTNSGVYNIRKTNRDYSQGLLYSFTSPADCQLRLFSLLCVSKSIFYNFGWIALSYYECIINIAHIGRNSTLTASKVF